MNNLLHGLDDESLGVRYMGQVVRRNEKTSRSCLPILGHPWGFQEGLKTSEETLGPPNHLGALARPSGLEVVPGVSKKHVGLPRRPERLQVT